MTKNMQNNMQNMQKKYVKKYANPFSICRILTGLYSAYFAYIYTPHFADGVISSGGACIRVTGTQL
jgi:hypothetical protein